MDDESLKHLANLIWEEIADSAPYESSDADAPLPQTTNQLDGDLLTS